MGMFYNVQNMIREQYSKLYYEYSPRLLLTNLNTYI